MDDRQLIANLLSALEYHTEQTRPIDLSKVAIQAAREYLRKPPQRKPLTDEQIDAVLDTMRLLAPRCIARAIEAAHGIKE